MQGAAGLCVSTCGQVFDFQRRDALAEPPGVITEPSSNKCAAHLYSSHNTPLFISLGRNNSLVK